MTVTTDLGEAQTFQHAQRKLLIHVILPLFLISVVAYLDRNNLSYAKFTMNDDLGFSESVYGLGAGIFFLGYLLFEVPGALIAERYSARLWLARIMISWGVLTGMMAFVTQPWHFYTLRFLIGVAEASLYPVLYATVMPRWFAASDRARAIAIMLSSLQVSAIIGSPLAGWLINVPLWGLEGWQALFLLEALPAVLFGFVVVFWLAEGPATARWLTEPERLSLMRHLASEGTGADKKARFTLTQVFGDREVLKLSLTYFLWMTGYWGFNYYAPTILKEVGWSNLETGWMMAAIMCLSLVVMLWVGHNSSQSGEKRWHGATGLFVAAVGMFLGAFVANAWLAYGCLALVGIGVYAALGVWWSYPTTFLRGAAAAGAIGLINSIGSSGGFFGPYLTGFVKTATGSFAGAWVFLAACLTGAGCLILTLRPRNVEAVS